MVLVENKGPNADRCVLTYVFKYTSFCIILGRDDILEVSPLVICF